MKNKAVKRFYIFIWIIIFVVSMLLLIENIHFIHKETKTINKELIDKVRHTEELLNPKIHSDIPILQYTADKARGGSHNVILDTLAKSFPINQSATDSNLASNSRVMNNKRRISDVIGIIEDIKSENQENNSKGNVESIDNSMELFVDIIDGGVEKLEGEEDTKKVETQEVVAPVNGEHFTLEQLLDRQFLYRNFYIVDPSTSVSNELFDANILVKKDLTIKKDSSKPQILIYHTHSQEAFSDSRKGIEEDTIVGVGEELARILSDYGYNVIHDKTKYDIMGEGLDRNLAYSYASDGIGKILEENPTIEVILDIHRDGGKKRVTNIDGVDAAQIMLFNGISTNTKGQPIERLPNKNLQGNLAFSLQIQLKGREDFPGLMYKNYLKSLRYNQHFRERSILAEVGTDKNTVAEAKNAMNYLGTLINEVVSE